MRHSSLNGDKPKQNSVRTDLLSLFVLPVTIDGSHPWDVIWFSHPLAQPTSLSAWDPTRRRSRLALHALRRLKALARRFRASLGPPALAERWLSHWCKISTWSNPRPRLHRNDPSHAR